MIIAIDGYSACGKSTLAKDIAKVLKFTYIDSGAMYRAVTYHILKEKIELKDSIRIIKLLDNIQINFKLIEGQNTCFLNGENVEQAIRSQDISDYVSEVSAAAEVRIKLVKIQRKLGQRSNVVMDGRDIGSVVFPNAEIKLFLNASTKIRAYRRLREYQNKGIDIEYQVVEENLKKRDYIDSTREHSPLVFPKGGIRINNSYLNREEQLNLTLKIIKIKKYNLKSLSH